MKLDASIKSALFCVMSISSLMVTTTEGSCTVHIYQRGDTGSEYGIHSFNHNDGSCSTAKNQVKLQNGVWKSISADKNHYSTIQNNIKVIQNCKIDPEGDTTCEWNGVNFNICDGITQKSMCSGSQVYKVSCNSHYVFYPDGQKSMCKAVLDDDGNPVLDNKGRPHGLCEDCKVQDQWVRHLRG